MTLAVRVSAQCSTVVLLVWAPRTSKDQGTSGSKLSRKAKVYSSWGAANATTSAREDVGLGHGILTAGIVDGLRSGLADVDNDGRITGPNLFSWCRDFAVKRGSNTPVQVNRVEDDDLVIAFSPRRLPLATVEAARQKLRVLWENDLLSPAHLDHLRQFFWAASVLIPPANSLPGDFL